MLTASLPLGSMDVTCLHMKESQDPSDLLKKSRVLVSDPGSPSVNNADNSHPFPASIANEGFVLMIVMNEKRGSGNF